MPCFGPELHANHGDNHFRFFEPLVRLARGRLPPFRILEVGSWAGMSLVAWGQAAPDAMLWAVDSWEPYLPAGSKYPHYDVMTQAAVSGGIEALFRRNIEAAGMTARVFVNKGKSADILPELPPEFFDVVYIDGDHRYSFVRDDIRNAVRLVGQGGILCGDDLDQQVYQLDPDEHRAAMAVDEEVATTRSGICYHHGVAQAVHEMFGPVSCFERRLWAVQRILDEWQNVSL